jgi:subtilisin family serine protease
MADKDACRGGKRRARIEAQLQRPKLDARLALLLSLPAAARRKLKAKDDTRTDELIEKRRGIVEKMKSSKGADREREEQELGELEREVVAPLTCGLFDPANSPKRPMPIADIDEEFVSALIWSEASSLDLEQLGVRLRSKVGDVFSTFLPLSAIGRLERSPSVRYIEIAQPLFPSLDRAIPGTNIDVLHGTMPAIDGAGVIVGIYDDSALDIYHPDFQTPAGRTRVLYLWDQTLSPMGAEAGPPTAPALPGFTPAGGATYGVEYDSAAIDSELANFNPPGTPAYAIVRHGGAVGAHGTHVAGIAAGNGRADNGRYMGAAPAADIIYVKSPNLHDTGLLADTTYMVDAFSYVFARAAQLGRPCVVNMSNSDDQGPHDGSRLGEQVLDDLLLLPGRAITLSAGNSNRVGSHAAGTVAVGTPADLVISFAAGAGADDVIEIWYDGLDRFDITVTLPTMPATIVGPVPPGGVDGASTPGGEVQIRVDSRLNDPRNGDNVISVVLIVTPGQSIPVGDTVISLNGRTVINGTFEAWIDRNNRDRSDFRAPFLREDETTLGVPATARRPLTAGYHLNPAPLTGAIGIWDRSGRGPTRDGRIKPEIATFGIITAPNSRDMNAAVLAPAAYVAKQGTSMSAPLVGGVCALLFQCRGATSTWANIKQILLDTATVAAPQNGFGYGYMQVQAACTAPLPNVDVWLRDDITDMGPEPFTGSVAWLSPDIQVLDRACNSAANPTYSAVLRFNNIIRVTVRNRGTRRALNTEVHLYWADPATNIPYPSAWNATGIYTGAPNFTQQGNSIVLPQIASGGIASVDFAFAPPAPGSSIRGDDHFCLLVRLENFADPSLIGNGGWSAVTARNNVGLRNVNVQTGEGGDAAMRFYVVGTDEQDSLTIHAGEFDEAIDLVVPVQSLVWRDMKMIDSAKRRRQPFGHGQTDDPLAAMKLTLEGDEIELTTDVVGAERLTLDDGLATLTVAKERRLHIPHLRITEGAKMIARIRVRSCKEAEPRRLLHVAQHSGGQLVGGVSLEVRPREHT